MQDPPSSRQWRMAGDCGEAAVIHLDTDAGEWLVVARPETPVRVVIGGRDRVPGAWMLHPGAGSALNRRLRAYPGDVILATWNLPVPVMATLGPALAKGASAVLGEFFRDPGNGAAIAVEAR